MRRAGRRRQVDARAAAIRAALASPQLEAPPVLAAAYGQVVAAAVAVIASLSEQLARLETALTKAFCAHADSPGARRYYDAHRARGATHHQALRALANRLVGILHGCLHHRQPYDEQVAWPTPAAAAT